jgi:cell division topological specificity factor
MSFLNFFTRNRSAPVARDRLQVLLAHERALSGRTDLAAVLQQEILAVIARHIPIDQDKVIVKLDRGDQVSTLEIDIEMPDEALAGDKRSPVSPPSRRSARTPAAPAR